MTTPNFDLNRYNELIAAGLPAGLGTKEHACIMGALNLACGGELSDAAESPCVLPAAARFAVRLNDAKWSTDKARAEGLRELGLAMLGTDGLDRKVFLSRLGEQTIRQIVPVFLRRAKLEGAAKRCEAEGTVNSARAGKSYAAADADGAAAAAAYAAYAAYAAAADGAAAAAAAAYAAYAAAADGAAAYAAYAAYAAAAAAAAAADGAAAAAAADGAPPTDAYDAAYADYRKKYGDETLILSANIATKILTDMKAEVRA